MAKRQYYRVEKRQKELKREKKNEAKLERRRLKKEAAEGGQPDDAGEAEKDEANLQNASVLKSGSFRKCPGPWFAPWRPQPLFPTGRGE